MKRLLIDLIWSQLRALGAFQVKATTVKAARQSGGLLPAYDAWFGECVRIFESVQYLERSGDQIVLAAPPDLNIGELWREWELQKLSWHDNPDLAHGHVLLEATVQALPEILTGKKAATEVIFPQSSLSLVENAYKTNPMSEFFNRAMAEQVNAYLQQRALQTPDAESRIIEIGAGTGATSAVIFEALKASGLSVTEYHYTDISRAFLHHAEQAYGPSNPFLSYGVLNIETPVAQQGIAAGTYDLVIAANVLHATKDIRKTLRNAKALLKKDGLLFLNEMTGNTLFNHLTFGLLEGWWLYEDPDLRLPGSPGLSVANWRHVLEAERYRAVAFPCLAAEDTGQQVIIAQSDGIVRVPTAPTRVAADRSAEPSSAAARAEASDAVGPAPQARSKSGMVDRVALAIVDELAKTLRIDANRVRLDEPFSSYGLDSILAVQLTNDINERLGVELDITVMFEHNTVDALRLHMASACGLAIAPEPSVPAIGAQLSIEGGERALESTPMVPPVSSQANTHQTGFAIVGMSARFPGADNFDAFWQVIEKGKSCISSPSSLREDWQAYVAAELAGTRQGAAKWGGFLDHVHDFDPFFFGISVAEARQMSPEQRLMLMCAWNALEDAGYTAKELGNEATGVFIAAAPSDYHPPSEDGRVSFASAPALSLIPNRISYCFNLHGPSEYCETACSSSLVALHRAIASLSRAECTHAIVGGVNLVLSEAGFAGMEAVGMLSPTGKVQPFQEPADGTVRAEGVGAILIKPLARAVEDGDHVYAVVRSTGVAHGGKGVSFTAPNIRGMKAAMQQAYAEAEVDPGTVSYVEAHGMSTALADGAELAALGSATQLFSKPPRATSADLTTPLYISCLKPCIGHTEAFSGMAALMKVVLAIRHRTIPAIPNFGQISPNLSLSGTRLELATQNIPWAALKDADGAVLPRRAAINSFGIGGVNAHAVIEEFVATPASVASAREPGPHVVVLSGKDEERLRERARQLIGWFEQHPSADLADVAYTLQRGREEMDCRLAFVAETSEQVMDELRAALTGEQKTQGVAFANSGRRVGEIIELCSSEVGEALIRTLVEQRKLNVVAKYWVNGAKIDWRLLHQGWTPRRIALPGYPFKNVNCWGAGAAFPVSQVAVSAPDTSQSDVAVGPAAFISKLVASVLGIDEAEIVRSRPLDYYGLNSLMLVTVLSHARSAFPAFEPSWLQANDTLDEVIARLSSLTGDGVPWSAAIQRPQFPELVHLNSVSQGRPVFWVHGALGSVETFQSIAERSQRPFYGIQARGFMTEHAPIEGIVQMAAYYIEMIRALQPHGPYDVGGFCLGGIVSYEVTRQLQRQGETVRSLVMVDSPDNTAFSKATSGKNIPARNAALQVANTLLWPPNEPDLACVLRRLIHQDEVDGSLSEDEFVERLVSLGLGRGLNMPRLFVSEFIKRNLKVQEAYQLGAYLIEPLTEPDAVDCTYFRNKNGLFLGDLAQYFAVAGETFSLDHVNYWQDWQRELKKLRIVDLEANNHMTILHEDRSLRPIMEFCEQLYAARRTAQRSSQGNELE